MRERNFLKQLRKKVALVAGAIVIGAAGFGIGMGTCTAQADAAVKNYDTVIKTPAKIRLVKGQYTSLQGYVLKSITDRDGIKAVSCSVKTSQKKYFKNIAAKGSTKYGVPSRKVCFTKTGAYTMYVAVRDKKNVRSVKKFTIIVEDKIIHYATGFRNFYQPVGTKVNYMTGIRMNSSVVKKYHGEPTIWLSDSNVNYKKAGLYHVTYRAYGVINGKVYKGTKTVFVRVYDRPTVKFKKNLTVYKGKLVYLLGGLADSVTNCYVGNARYAVYPKYTSDRKVINFAGTTLSTLRLRFKATGRYPIHVKIVDKKGNVTIRGAYVNVIEHPEETTTKEPETTTEPETTKPAETETTKPSEEETTKPEETTESVKCEHDWEEETTQVEHPQKTKTVTYVKKPAWTEEKAVYEMHRTYKCHACGKNIGFAAEAFDHCSISGEEDDCKEWNYSNRAYPVEIGFAPVKIRSSKTEHLEETATTKVVTSLAWSETKVTGYKCKKCGATCSAEELSQDACTHEWRELKSVVAHPDTYMLGAVAFDPAGVISKTSKVEQHDAETCNNCGAKFPCVYNASDAWALEVDCHMKASDFDANGVFTGNGCFSYGNWGDTVGVTVINQTNRLQDVVTNNLIVTQKAWNEEVVTEKICMKCGKVEPVSSTEETTTEQPTTATAVEEETTVSGY